MLPKLYAVVTPKYQAPRDFEEPSNDVIENDGSILRGIL